MNRGLSGGGRRFGNSIAPLKRTYFGGVFYKIKFLAGIIFFLGDSMVRDGVLCAETQGNQLFICFFHAHTVWGCGWNVVSCWDWILHVDGKGTLSFMHGRDGEDMNRRML